MRTHHACIVIAGLALACGPADRESPSASAPDGGGEEGGGGGGSGGGGGGGGGGSDGSAEVTYVYAHSDQELYRVDPDTLEIELVGSFGWPDLADEMTDIAIDRDGRMIGISFDRVYRVDTDTADCTYLAPLDRSFNGLSFVPSPGGAGEEMLIGAALDGSVYEIDPATGASTRRGQFGGDMGSSGDIVSVEGFGTAATVTVGLDESSDRLALVDPASGAATLVGDTGVADIWGLGFWADKVFGFAEDGRFVLIDVQTGAAQEVERSGVHWWGAGVTTQAEVTVD